ncbi:hypothetical protein [Lysobacter sp. CA199]|uniref:hypothetical protein n=1 Tax=Lysobacter sp. CA199 TaxID=3455608 RepID=UPI003F8D4C35
MAIGTKSVGAEAPPTKSLEAREVFGCTTKSLEARQVFDCTTRSLEVHEIFCCLTRSLEAHETFGSSTGNLEAQEASGFPTGNLEAHEAFGNLEAHEVFCGRGFSPDAFPSVTTKNHIRLRPNDVATELLRTRIRNPRPPRTPLFAPPAWTPIYTKCNQERISWVPDGDR